MVVSNGFLLQSDFVLAQARGTPIVPAYQSPSRWCKPGLRSVKINIDGAFIATTKLAAIRRVARVHDLS
ncbi:hypothetical protein GQ457_15G026620 [Hibiscus cannabinus]